MEIDTIIQMVIAIASIFVAVIGIYGLTQLKLMRRANHMELVSKSRGDWTHIADVMVANPKMVLLYANDKTRRHFDAISSKKEKRSQLKEYAFANRIVETISSHYYISKEKGNKEILEKLYPEGLGITSIRLKEIWKEWGLNEEHPDEFCQFMENEVFRR